ncbi:MAG: DUF4340 domain-containing protein [Bacteroidetes bacterium]|nr:DUF4340 domain-containing protein [Bacteroidota bacterium]MBP6638654.1 DUF4340 domain-containing protein [Bacteroidia bacterium]
MKKKTLLLLAALIALVGAYFVFAYQWHGPDNEFHIADAKTVGKVEIELVKATISESKVTLERAGENEWKLNGKYDASLIQVNDFLKTLTDIRVKEPISNKAQATSLSLLKRNHTHVKIWDKEGKLLKDYLIGPANNQQTANIFKMEFSDKCYMVSKPALDGYVSIYYSTNESDWRDRGIWNLKGEDLKSVAATYANDTLSQSFALRLEAGKWRLGDGQFADSSRIANYLALFQGKINAETFADTQYPKMMDSLTKRVPDAQFTVETTAGARTSLLLFAREDSPANFFAFIEGKKDLLTVQHFVIDPFLKSKGFFAAGVPQP